MKSSDHKHDTSLAVISLLFLYEKDLQKDEAVALRLLPGNFPIHGGGKGEDGRPAIWLEKQKPQ